VNNYTWACRKTRRQTNHVLTFNTRSRAVSDLATKLP